MTAVLLAVYTFGPWVMLAGATFGTMTGMRGSATERQAGLGLGIIALLLLIVLVDPVDLLDGPMRLDSENQLVGTGSPMFDFMRNWMGGPRLWLVALAGLGFGLVLWRSWSSGPLRIAALIGLIGITLHLVGHVGVRPMLS